MGYNNNTTNGKKQIRVKRRGKKHHRNTERYSVIIGEKESEGEGDVLAGD